MGLYTKNKAFLGKIIQTKFVANRWNFSNIKKGGAKRGGRALWVPPNHDDMFKKVENFTFFMLETCRWKGVQKGGHEKWGGRRGHHSRTLVPTIHSIIRASDKRFLGKKSDFLHNCRSVSYAGTCPPLCPPFFQNFNFQKFEISKFTRIKNQLHTTFGSEYIVLWSQKPRF